MNCATRIVGILFLIGGIGASIEYLEKQPDFDLLGNPGAGWELMGMLLMSVLGMLLIVNGSKKKDGQKLPEE